MSDELRIYYESLEQGNNFIRPLVENSIKKIKKRIDVKLIKLKGSHKYYSKRVSPIIFWKNPDILITIVKNKIEYPLIQIEFSNAVFTEDHELQRFDGLVASAINNCIYAKISPLNKKSQSDHGGKKDFDHLGPYSLIFKKFNKMFYHFDWECDKKGSVIIDSDYLSCPKKLKNFDIFIDRLISLSLKQDISKKNWISIFEKEIVKEKDFNEWKNKLNSFKNINLKNLKSSRTTYDKQGNLFLKLNRFGHAMDPERGMLSYYGTLHNKIISKMIFNTTNKSWYKDIPKTKEINSYLRSKGLKNNFDFLYCFMLGSGLYNNDYFYNLVKNINKENLHEIDLTEFIKENYFSLNKAIRTIFKYSNSFIIVDKQDKIRIKFVWKKINENEDYKKLPEVTNISERKSLEEDDVTYIIVHQILKPNKYKILAVSYPGAQSDRVILVAPGTGRGQERKYIDIISYLPKKVTNLQENKGKYSPSSVQYEIDNLSKYKTEKEYKEGFNSFINRFDKNAPKVIKLGVGFWANINFTISKVKELDLKELDYFIYITPNMKEWIIWKTGKGDFFSKTKGKISLPKTFEVF